MNRGEEVVSIHMCTPSLRESESIKRNRRVIQQAHNVSTQSSVGVRPRGTLPNTQGRDSKALSAEILIIHLHSFRKAKHPDEGAVEPRVGSEPGL